MRDKNYIHGILVAVTVQSKTLVKPRRTSENNIKMATKKHIYIYIYKILCIKCRLVTYHSNVDISCATMFPVFSFQDIPTYG
jgi:hypothetical protein